MDSTQPPPPPPPPRPPYGPPPQFRVPQRPPAKITSGKAIAAFVLGLFSLFFWFVTAIPALILALMARADIRRDPERVSGSGLAAGGAVLALIGLILPPLVAGLLMSVFPGGGVDRFAGGPRMAHVHLSGPLVDVSTYQSPFSLFGAQAISLVDLLRVMNRVEDDDDVKGIIFTVDGFYFGSAQREELTDAFQSLKDAGKEIYVHTTTLDTQSYALFAHATHLSMAPTDLLFLTGLYGEGLYIKDLLDAIEAEFQVIHIGEFKSAGEMFTRSGPSPAADANQNWLMDSLYAALLASIAEAREMEPSYVEELVDGGPYTVEEALELDLIDSVWFVDDFVDGVEEQHRGIAIDNDYYARLNQEWQEDPSAPMTDLLRGQGSGRRGNPMVGIINIEGPILPGYGGNATLGTDPAAYGDVLRKIIDNAADDPDIAAVVVRVNSPGGSVTASEVILHALTELQEQKPVVVSMGDVAASGGYYVACRADHIFADTSTITGSIGVVSGKLVLGGTWDELGIDWHPYKRGENADIFSTTVPFNDVQVARIRESMEKAYDVFKDHVVAGRGELLTDPIEELAAGRVFTGVQALDAGLVDEVGTLRDAVRYAAELAGVDNYNAQLLPEWQDFWTMFFQDLSGTGERPSDLEAFARQTVAKLTGSSAPEGYAMFRELEPARARGLAQALLALHLMQQERVVALDLQLLNLP